MTRWWRALRRLQTLYSALRALSFVAAILVPWLTRSARFRLMYAMFGLVGGLIGYLWGRAERVPYSHDLDAKVRRHLILAGLCFVGYIALGFILEDWIPMLVVRSPSIYESGTFIRYGAWIHAAVWGFLFLILIRLLTWLGRAASRDPGGGS
jgi:hypothetical protein